MDTQKITQDLLSTGLTQQQLANLASCSQSAINAFASGKRGSRPSLSIGLRLLALHQERCMSNNSERGGCKEMPLICAHDDTPVRAAGRVSTVGPLARTDVEGSGQTHAGI